MSFGQEFFLTIIGGIIGGSIPAVLAFVFGFMASVYDSHKQRREERVEAIVAWINQLGYIESLYRLWARERKWLERDDEGKLNLDSEGQPIIRQKALQISEQDVQALISLLETDSPEQVLQHRILELRLEQTQASDAAALIDKSGELNRKLGKLYWTTVDGLDFWRRQKDFQNFRHAMKDSTEQRRKILRELDQKRGFGSVLGSIVGL